MLCFVSSFHTRAWGWGGLGSGVHRSHKRVKATLTDCVPRALVWLQAFPHTGDQRHQAPVWAWQNTQDPLQGDVLMLQVNKEQFLKMLC